MMAIIEFLLLILLVIACVYFSYTDLRYNRIKNSVLLKLGGIGLALEIVLYGCFRRDAIVYYAATVALISAVSIVMYALHIWAAGDSKFMILLALLIPSSGNESGMMIVNEIMIPVYAFGIGFLYLIGDTAVHLIKEKRSILRGLNVNRYKYVLQQFLINCIYVIAILKIEDFILQKWNVQLGVFQLVFNLCLMILLGKMSLFQRKETAGFVLGASVLYSFGTGVWMLEPIRLVYYALSFLYVLIQVLISEFNYQEIWTRDVEEGMILSLGTSILFMQSRVVGLPGVSFEDMRSRLNKEEAAAVKKWGKSKYGREKIVIVRKVPFALFISVGCLIYLVIRGIR